MVVAISHGTVRPRLGLTLTREFQDLEVFSDGLSRREAQNPFEV